MKKLIVYVVVAMLAACSTGANRHVDELRSEDNLRKEFNLAMTFPQIQQALFRHARVCNTTGPEFKMDEGQASFARIIEQDSLERPWNQRILIDLMWLEPSLMHETRTRVQVYSFFENKVIEQRIDAIFKAISHPDECESGS